MLREFASNVKFVFAYLMKFSRVYLWLGLLSAVLSGTDPIYQVLPAKVLLNGLTERHSLRPGLMFLGALMVLAATTNALAQWYRYSYRPPADVRLRQQMREALMRKATQIDCRQIDNPEFYNLYTRALDKADSIILDTFNAVLGSLGQLLSILVLGTLIVSMNPVVLAFAVVSTALSIFLGTRQSTVRYAQHVARVPHDRRTAYAGRVFYLREFVTDLKLSRISDVILGQQSGAYQQIAGIARKFAWPNMSLNYGLTVTGLASFLVLMSFLGWTVYTGRNTIGDFAALLAASGSLQMVLSGVFNVVPTLQQQSLYVRDLRAFLRTGAEIERDEGLECGGLPAEITLEGVGFSYGAPKGSVLRDVNLTIGKGEKIALVGHNGAGKSTLVKLLTRLYDPSEGRVLFGGVDYRQLRVSTLRSRIGVAFQGFEVYAASIAENVLMRPMTCNSDQERVWAALRQTGLENKVRSLPDGIMSELTSEFSEKGVSLSGGETQKLVLARVAALDCDVVILDEPASAMDARSEQAFYESMLSVLGTRAVVFISHRLWTARLADRIYVLSRGTVVECGTHDALMQLGGEYATTFRMQASRYLASDVAIES